MPREDHDAGDLAGLFTPRSPTPTGSRVHLLTVALIPVCGHVLHDTCLKEWAERSNSCPICRTTFNMVEVLDKIGGRFPYVSYSTPHFLPLHRRPCFWSFAVPPPIYHVTRQSSRYHGAPRLLKSKPVRRLIDLSLGTTVSTYDVKDKKQIAEFDPLAWIEENPEEEPSLPCPICGLADNEDVLLLCDTCDAPYHTYCVGLERVPTGNWYCAGCADDPAYSGVAVAWQDTLARRSLPRTQETVRQHRRQERAAQGFPVWNNITNRIHAAVGLDLDFADDDQSMANYRRHQHRVSDQRRELRQWQQRLHAANQRTAERTIQDVGAAGGSRIVTPAVGVRATPASAFESRAWGDLDRAKELDTSSPGNRKRKIESSAASPVGSPLREEPERKLKRPRTRRVLDNAGSSSATSSHQSPRRPVVNTSDEPSFLASLLREVETASTDDRFSWSPSITVADRAFSPSNYQSSPALSPSPLSSTYHTPRSSSITPPPHVSTRPASPPSSTTRVERAFPPRDHSRSRSHDHSRNHSRSHSCSYSRSRSRHRSPEREGRDPELTSPTPEIRQPRPIRQEAARPRSQGSSPTRANMSLEAKEGVNQIVKSALTPHWRSGKLTKDQYSEINRSVSRKMYDIVGGRYSHDERDQCAWQKIAAGEVATAIRALEV